MSIFLKTILLVTFGIFIASHALFAQCANQPPAEDGTETFETGNCNFNNLTFTCGDQLTGPVRAGLFATSSTTTRPPAGAGYYGNMELTGNVTERVVTVGNSAGLAFSGTHGDGTLSSVASYAGNATNLDWPGIDATSQDRGVTAATGSGFKGGHWSSLSTSGQLKVSNRAAAAQTDSARASTYGGRLVRTAP